MSGAAAVAAEPATEETVTEEVNPLSMSDEDIMNMTAPGQASTPAEQETPAASADPATDGTTAVQEKAAEGAGEEGKPAPDPAAKDAEPKPGADPAGSAEGTPAAASDAAAPAEGDPAVGTETSQEETPDYKGFFEKVMTPFKANNKTIQLKNPEEAIKLMQMGANYTRKMQELVPHRKTLAMLQNNNIDESRLSFLIDLDKKDPEAIKKLIKDSNIDPLEIDMTSEPAYRGGNHQVSDEEVNFRTALEELSSTQEGQKTISVIDGQWDQASKDVLWRSPEMMALIHGQREFGIYDRIVAEMDRQKTLGQLPATTPFLQAYRTVGDQLTAAGAFNDLFEKSSDTAPKDAPSPAPAEGKTDPTPVATRTAVPKPAVKENIAASAASPTRASPSPAQPFVNPLSMSDDEFMSKFNGRL